MNVNIVKRDPDGNVVLPQISGHVLVGVNAYVSPDVAREYALALLASALRAESEMGIA